ncbi:bifunctional 23S rRNA (guanine(2069)-N(7))-methyltransferase RlmK/23S rRNA (guanine(2445)-N(2))-methyltransferase RlmL [Pseudomonadota bacterium]
MNSPFQLFATVPKGMVAVLMSELSALGAQAVREQPAGVEFKGDLELAYRVCLWSRVAGRILLPLGKFDAANADELYSAVQQINWQEHLPEGGTFAVDFTGRSEQIRHTQFGALRIKDAIVDQIRAATGERPSIDTECPDLRINAHLYRDMVTISLDLSGDSLHKRRYRAESVVAPLKENLAAAILLRAGWSDIAAKQGYFVDPMCGSGTLLIEAAMIAADIAPGLMRTYFGFLGWRKHDVDLWQKLLGDAEHRKAQGVKKIPPIYGYDLCKKSIAATLENVAVAGLDEHIRVCQRDVAELVAPAGAGTGLLVVNPPYGERLGEKDQLMELYALLGSRLKTEFSGWQAAVFTSNPDLAKRMGIRAQHVHNMFNGALECQLLRFDVAAQYFMTPGKGPRPARPEELGPGAEMLANRLRKNLKELGRWAKRERVDCYRLYDADMPEYNVAVDVYQGEKLWVHLQEYEAPKKVDSKKARTRLKEVLAVVPDVLGIPHEQMFFKVRQKQKGSAQYEKQAAEQQFYQVQENGLKFWVNFNDYLDTGLFLDHRTTRKMVADLSKDKRVLNLFAYTGSVSVYAAAGGAASTTTVDMSNTYLDWAKRNMDLNGFTGSEHEFIQADCIQWLADQTRFSGKSEPSVAPDSPWSRESKRYDVIFFDPPTFSTSKRMKKTFDVQRDHAELLNDMLKLLEPGGVLVFSNNYRRFKLDEKALKGVSIEDVTKQTIPRDFIRNSRIHCCWKISKN